MTREIRSLLLSRLLILLLSWNDVTNAFAPHSPILNPRRRGLDGRMFLFFTDVAKTNGVATRNGRSSNEEVPFVIEKLSDMPNQSVFEEIAEMCIDVFFNHEPTPTTPWKQVQLTYLRNLQQSDLTYRRTSRRNVNDMFVARRVLPVSKLLPASSNNNKRNKAATTTVAALKRPLILDINTIINLNGHDDDDDNEEYVKDKVIGFVEVTEKQFGFGQQQQQQMQSTRSIVGRYNNKQLRPVLTNLAVHPTFRKAGVGSRLLQACEDVVTYNWNHHDEIVLEVEDDNPRALDFYSKRGYAVVFADPASRRYDVNGFFLQKKQCTKICMRKSLMGNKSSNNVVEDGEAGSFPFVGTNRLLQSLRESVFSK